jgi:hypothetical protein
MTPNDVDDLGDELFAAMVRRMQAEAAAVQASAAKLNRR